ncbi:MAG TPA: helix-turn-helix domain-containing protein [Lachnospiraceae bacterium]|nr:helix-turn-helix domain-containing protein [Lachnospiraceae bacterium]
MNEIDMIESLIQFGITRQEAIIYLCLCRGLTLTGYEVAKQTGISRSNVYTALAGLVEKGAAYLLEGTSAKYTAVSIQEYCDNRLRYLMQIKNNLVNNIHETKKDTDGYITIGSYKHILDKIYNMLLNAEQRIYISIHEEVLKAFQFEIESCIQKNIKVVIITNGDPKIEGANVYITKKKDSQLRFIVDSKYVLTGEITGKITDSCLYCANQNFVNVFKEALRNEIKLIELNDRREENE